MPRRNTRLDENRETSLTSALEMGSIFIRCNFSIAVKITKAVYDECFSLILFAMAIVCLFLPKVLNFVSFCFRR